MPHTGTYYPIEQAYRFWNSAFDWPYFWPSVFKYHTAPWGGSATHPNHPMTFDVLPHGWSGDRWSIYYLGYVPNSSGYELLMTFEYRMAPLVADAYFEGKFFKDGVLQQKAFLYAANAAYAQQINWPWSWLNVEPGATLYQAESATSVAAGY